MVKWLTVKWFHENKMIVDPDKFQVIVLHKRKSSNTEVKIYHWFRANSSGDKLNFSLHFDKICLKPANQLNSLVRIKRFSGNEERKFLINSFVLPNFNYCPLVRILANAKSEHKIEVF